MSRPVRITLARLVEPFKGEEGARFSGTLYAMCRCVDMASASGARIVVFPEICVYLGAEKPWQFEALNGPTVTAMAAKAREHGIYVGLPVPTLEDGIRYNSVVLLDRAGDVAGIYHKNVPTHGELDVGIRPGTETPVFDTDFGRIGFSICFDLNYWEVGARLAEKKPELVIWASMWPGRRFLAKWSIEFGFQMAAASPWGALQCVDVCGHDVEPVRHERQDPSECFTFDLDLDMRLLHHDGNKAKMPEVERKYPGDRIIQEYFAEECLLAFGSAMEDKSADDLIREFGLELMTDYLARVRRDRQRALDGAYPVKG